MPKFRRMTRRQQSVAESARALVPSFRTFGKAAGLNSKSHEVQNMAGRSEAGGEYYISHPVQRHPAVEPMLLRLTRKSMILLTVCTLVVQSFAGVPRACNCAVASGHVCRAPSEHTAPPRPAESRVCCHQMPGAGANNASPRHSECRCGCSRQEQQQVPLNQNQQRSDDQIRIWVADCAAAGGSDVGSECPVVLTTVTEPHRTPAVAAQVLLCIWRT